MSDLSSVTSPRPNLLGIFPLQPTRIRFQPGRYLFTLGHTGFVIGDCYVLTLLLKDSVGRALLPTTLDLPDFEDLVEGDCIIGQALLYDSALADIAWRGLQQDIFSHACAVLLQEPDDPDGASGLAEIALVSEVEAGCPGARVLKSWLGPLPDTSLYESPIHQSTAIRPLQG